MHRREGVLVLVGEGELDAYTAPALADAVSASETGPGARLVVDLSRVSFMDSTALGVLVRIVRAVVAGGGAARVVLPETAARRIFEITTLDRALPVAVSRAEALLQLASTGP
jgi:anti-anti-sigma factor